MKRLLVLVFLSLSLGCATATKYGPMTDEGGYEDKKVSDGVYQVHVAANARTDKKTAEDYFLRRGGELCQAEGSDYFDVLASDVSTTSVERVTKTYVMPTTTTGNVYGSGTTTYTPYGAPSGTYNHNFQGSYQGTQYGGGSHTSSYDVHHVFPNIVGMVMCFKNSKRSGLGILLKNLDEKEASSFNIPDKLGASQAIRVLPDVETKVEVGDVIVKINGKRVLDSMAIVQALKDLEPGTSVSVDVIREGKTVRVTSKLNSLKVTFGPEQLRNLASGK